jgi:hypothetical protein
MVRKERPDISEGHGGVRAPIVPGQQQPSEPGEGRMFQEVVDAVVDTQMGALSHVRHREILRRHRWCVMQAALPHLEPSGVRMS